MANASSSRIKVDDVGAEEDEQLARGASEYHPQLLSVIGRRPTGLAYHPPAVALPAHRPSRSALKKRVGSTSISKTAASSNFIEPLVGDEAEAGVANREESIMKSDREWSRGSFSVNSSGDRNDRLSRYDFEGKRRAALPDCCAKCVIS